MEWREPSDVEPDSEFEADSFASESPFISVTKTQSLSEVKEFFENLRSVNSNNKRNLIIANRRSKSQRFLSADNSHRDRRLSVAPAIRARIL